jgi:hypothetical protein
MMVVVKVEVMVVTSKWGWRWKLSRRVAWFPYMK